MLEQEFLEDFHVPGHFGNFNAFSGGVGQGCITGTETNRRNACRLRVPSVGGELPDSRLERVRVFLEDGVLKLLHQRVRGWRVKAGLF